MKFLSIDQKPSHFNNVALLGTWSRKGTRTTVKELFAHSRTRYTICTCVQSWASSQDELPPVAVLFKGSKKGHIVAQLKEAHDIPDWMLLQTQEYGSYRSEDMLDFKGLG